MALEQLRQTLQDAQEAVGLALDAVETAITQRDELPAGDLTAVQNSSTASTNVTTLGARPPGDSFADSPDPGVTAADPNVPAGPGGASAPVVGQHDPLPPPVVGVPDETRAAPTQAETTSAPAPRTDTVETATTRTGDTLEPPATEGF